MNVKKLIMILGGLIVAIVIAVGFSVLLWGVYIQRWDTPFTRAVVSIIPVPVARVGNTSIPLSRYYKDVDSLKMYFASEDAKSAGVDASQFGDVERKQAMERLIEEAAIQEMAAIKKVSVSDKDIESAIDTQFVSPSSTRQDLENNIKKNYGWSMQDFREHIVRPILLERKLAELANPEDPQTGMTDVIADLSARITEPDVVRYVKFDDVVVTQ